MVKKRINARAFVEDFHSGLSDLDLMLKYELDEDDLQVLFKKVLAAGMLPEVELKGRLSTLSRSPEGSRSDVAHPAPSKSPVPEPGPAKRDPDRIRPSPVPVRQRSRGKDKSQVCPFCSKEIPYGAVQCDHCRAWLDGRDLGVDSDMAAAGDRSQAVKIIAKGIAGMLVGLMTIYYGGTVGLFVGTLVVLASMGYYTWGCCLYIGTKGYHLAAGLLGLIPCFIGLIVLVAMPEK